MTGDDPLICVHVGTLAKLSESDHMSYFSSSPHMRELSTWREWSSRMNAQTVSAKRSSHSFSLVSV